MNAYSSEGPVRKLVMWYKVRELFEKKHLKKTQIANILGMDVKTVRRYLRMDFSEFTSSQAYKREYGRKLDPYEKEVRQWLEEYEDLSSAQVHDWLKERHHDLPEVNDKTVYNYVRYLRVKYDMPKPSALGHRQYAKLVETEYGEYGQVDFGESWMKDSEGHALKVYFFAMVLSRSRKKFVHFSLSPFTTDKTVYAHELAFEYYGGKPKKIIYDQDAVLIRSENYGDYLLTHAFKAFVDQQHIDVIFCRKADPESKGLVENVVKYIKYNYLRCRVFHGIDALNEDGMLWLDRTGNGTPNGTTGLVPDEVFEIEKPYLVPYYGKPMMPERSMSEYKIYKTNVIQYHGNTYSVPIGSYKGPKTMAWVDEKDGGIDIYDKETGKIIATHEVPEGKGEYVVCDQHRLRRHIEEEKLEQEIKEYCGNDGSAIAWMKRLREEKGRYYRMNLHLFSKEMRHFSPATLHKVFSICLEKGLANSKDFIRLCEQSGERLSVFHQQMSSLDNLPDYVKEGPEKTDISSFEKYIDETA